MDDLAREPTGMQALRRRVAIAPTSTDYRPAIDAHAQRLIARIRDNHLDTEAVHALQAHYETHGDYPSLANLLEGWAQTLRDDRKAADAYVAAAEAVLAGMADRRRARALYRRALARFPEHALALSNLETLLSELGDHSDLERTLGLIVRDLERRDADPKLRASVHYRLGQLYERRLLLLGRAVSQYRSAIELDPTLAPAIAAAHAIYLRSGRTEAAADMHALQKASAVNVDDDLAAWLDEKDVMPIEEGLDTQHPITERPPLPPRSRKPSGLRRSSPVNEDQPAWLSASGARAADVGGDVERGFVVNRSGAEGA
jgi:tetratricopeptide (TPR) repeat protein